MAAGRAALCRPSRPPRRRADHRAGRRERAAQLPFHPGLAGADQRRGGRHPPGAHRLPAARGRPGAGEPRHPEQRLRAAAAAKRDSVHVRPGDRHEQLRDGLGQRHRRRWSPGSRSISACGGPTWPPPRRRKPSPKPRSSAPSSKWRRPRRTPISRWSPRRRRCAPRRPAWTAREVIVRTTDALVSAELRPGADASRAEAELAAARTQLIQAQQAVDVARATVSQFVGMEPAATRHLRAAVAAVAAASEPSPPLDPAANPFAAGTKRRGRTGQGATARPRAIVLPAVLPARRRLRARHRRGDRWQAARRPQRPGAQRAELRAGLHA